MVGGVRLEQIGGFWHFPEIGHKGRGADLVVGIRRWAWPAPGQAAQVKEAMNHLGKGSEWSDISPPSHSQVPGPSF